MGENLFFSVKKTNEHFAFVIESQNVDEDNIRKPS